LLGTSASEVGYLRQTKCATDSHNHRSQELCCFRPDIWNSLPTDLRLSSLSTATFARHLKAHLFRSTESHIPAARRSFFKAALFISDSIIIVIVVVVVV